MWVEAPIEVRKGALDPMELQLYMVVKPSGVGAGNSLNL